MLITHKKIFACIFIGILSVFLASNLFPQTKLDSLTNLLSDADGVEKVTILNDIAFEINDKISQEDDLEVIRQTIAQLDEATTQALEAAQSVGDELQIARAQRIRGDYFYHSRNFSEMFKWHYEALTNYKSIDLALLRNETNLVANIHSNIDAENYLDFFSSQFTQLDEEIAFVLLFRIGINHYFKGNYPFALSVFSQLYHYSEEVADTTWISSSSNALGNVAYTQGDYNKALEYFMESLRIREQMGDKAQIASAMLNIGNVHKAIKSWDTAKDYYLQALSNFEEIDNKPHMAICLNNIGIIYEEDNQLDEAESYYRESLNIREVLGDSVAIMNNYINLGSLYNKKKDYRNALSSYIRARNIAQRIGDRMNLALISNNIGDVYFHQGNYDESIKYFNNSLEISSELGVKNIIALNYESLSKAFEKVEETEKALQYFKNLYEIRNELLNENNQKVIAEMQTIYETEKKEQQIALMNKDMLLRDAVIKRDRYVKISMTIGIAFVIIFAVYVYIQLQDKKKKNILLAKQNHEIQKQKTEIEVQRDLLAKQKQEITDSIRYAQRIQKAILPPDQISEDIMPEHFVLFKPRDIVSGDFYWIASQTNKTYIVAADCTGHGVPGAFMSMLGVAFLNEIVLYHKRTEPHEILIELRNLVKTTLAQSGQKDEAKDGMDISLCVINWIQKTIQYSGAYNPLYYFRNGEFNEIKANKMPIGVHIRDNEPFTLHELNIERGDTFYIFSDGFVDQFGGEDGRKFMTKNFKRLLDSIQSKSMSEQHQILDKTITEWRGEYEQVDDICIVGFRFKEV